MRFPFVSRAVYEDLRTQLAAEQARFDALLADHRAVLAKYEAVATAHATPPVIPPREKREEDEADTAIAFVANGDPARRRYLERFAKAERRAGVAPKDIASRILVGDRTAEDDDE